MRRRDCVRNLDTISVHQLCARDTDDYEVRILECRVLVHLTVCTRAAHGLVDVKPR